MLNDKIHLLFISGWAFKKEALSQMASELADNLNCSFTLEEACSLLPQQNQLPIPGSIIIVGWSMGALLALELYLKNPEKIGGLILLAATAAFCSSNPSFGIPLQNVRAMKIAMRRAPENTINDFVSLASSPSVICPKIIKDNIVDAKLKNTTPSLIAGLDYLMQTNFYPLLNHVVCPALIMAATADKVVPCTASKVLAEKLPDSYFEEIKNAGHIFPIIEMDTVSEKIANWLARRL
jgi:pimeloyl-ACP methyl ester carboxylesterase